MNKIAIVAHADFGKITITPSMVKVIDDNTQEAKTINQLIEEQNSTTITPQFVELTQLDFKSGKEKRREKRAKERKQNKKH